MAAKQARKPGQPQPFRVYSWNVNGIRAASKKGYLEWLKNCRGSVVCLQETRAREDQLENRVRTPGRWHTHYVSAERGGYSGVAMLSRRPFDDVQTSLGAREFDIEGRIQIAKLGSLWIVNGYYPNGSGKERDNGRVPYKLRFYRTVFRLLQGLRKHDGRVIALGDFNTAHREIDLARPKPNEKTSGFLPEERRELDRWICAGWVDTFRHFEPGPHHYTWWSQRFGVREKNVGWRIDYILASPAAMHFVRNAGIQPHVKGSDHCPIYVDFEPEVIE